MDIQVPSEYTFLCTPPSCISIVSILISSSSIYYTPCPQFSTNIVRYDSTLSGTKKGENGVTTTLCRAPMK